jgi:nucleotide-binding universal stress UspA family protein
MSDMIETRRALVCSSAAGILTAATIGSLIGVRHSRWINNALRKLTKAADGRRRGDLESPFEVDADHRELSLVANALRLGVQLVRGSADIPALLTVVRDERDRPRGEEILDLGRRSLEGMTPEFKELVRVGQPAEEILREAERENYELIVMGGREKQGLVTRFALGTTSERVVEHAPCPVMIAKGMPREIRRILLCDSGAESPSLAEEPLTSILRFELTP